VKDQFEVWRYDFPDKGGEHPVILISHPDICARAAVVNILFCTSQRQARQPYAREVLLDTSDGLDWETFCDCSCLYAIRSKDLFGKRGRVTLERRLQIRTKIRDTFCLSATD
jgi:mRNA-degrading endonuclease toxin of MazEF toxin-antitoxin module